MKPRPILLSAFLLLVISASSQADSVSLQSKAKFKAGAFFNSHFNYYGRTDSLKSNGAFLLGEIWLDQHFYISGAAVFVRNSRQDLRYEATIATAGYMFRNKKWGGHTYLVVPVYRNGSGLVQSALKFQVASSFTKISKVISVTAGADIKYSDRLDYGATAGIDHAFRFEGEKGWIFVADPSAYVNAGTQQFTKTSYKQSGFLIFPGAQQAVTTQVSDFNILSYEFSVPLVLAKGKWQFIANPAYVIPQHLVTVPNRPDLSERGGQLFYITAGIKVQL
jgi:hypothetical protein